MGNKTKIRVGHLKITDHLVLGVTLAKLAQGVEEFQHTELEPHAMTGWNDMGEALTNGSIDVAFMLAPYAMELFGSGMDLRLFLFTHKEGSVIVANKNANITCLEDFRDKTVLIPYHQSVHHMLFDKLLKTKGLKTGIDGDVMFEVVAPSQIPQIIEWDEDGDVGGYIVAEPFGEQVIASGLGTRFMQSNEIWPDHPCCVAVANADFMSAHEDAFMELTASLVKSGMLIQQKPESAVKVGANFLGQDEKVMNAILNPAGSRLKTTELKPVLDDLETMQNYLTSEVSAMSHKIDLEKFVDARFAKEAGAK